MSDSRRPAEPRKPTRREGTRYETCKDCGLEWNVSKQLVIDWRGYLCPRCRERRRKELYHE